MPILELTSRERSDLRSAAHPLRPVVLIGDNGLTEAVLKEIDLALSSHGLIKVRAGGDDREARDTMLSTICDTLSCAPVHHLGKTLILFRPLAGNVKPAALASKEPEASAKRRSSEPYTPKKLAAEGKTLSKRPRRSETEEPKPAKTRYVPQDELNKNGKPMRPSNKRTASGSHGIPRRAGSAMSLRAGARSGTSRKSSKK